MRTDDKDPAQQARLTEGMRLIFDQDSSVASRSPCTSSRSSSRDSSDSSRSSTVSRGSRHRRASSRSSESSSSSSSRSRSRSRPPPRCHRSSYSSRCRRRCQSRTFSPSPRRSTYRRRSSYSRSSSRSSSRGRSYRYSRRSRSRSFSYNRRRAFIGRFRYRYSPSPRRSYRSYKSRSRSPEYSVRLSQKDKMDLLNIAKENAAKILGVQEVALPSSVQSLEQQEKRDFTDFKKWMSGDSVLKSLQDDGSVRDGNSTAPRSSPTRKPIMFSINNTTARPSCSPPIQSAESKVTSRADSVGNRKPYGRWIPVKSVSPKKR